MVTNSLVETRGRVACAETVAHISRLLISLVLTCVENVGFLVLSWSTSSPV